MFGNTPRYIVAELSYTKEELLKMREGSIRRALNKADKALRHQGAENVFLSGDLRQIIPYDSLKDKYKHNRTYQIPVTKMFACYKHLREKADGLSTQKTQKAMIISDGKLQAVTIEDLADVCMDARRIILRTGEGRKAKSLADVLFEEYGVLIETEENDFLKDDTFAYFLIDVDKGRIRVGDCVADGAELVSGSGIYELDPAEESFYLGAENAFDIKSLLLGKNKLKIS
ncbi:MAG: hypothetical protein IJA16_03820 [Clostridia bacterium]|nr:hypothetical protein [Clostridia bacterium]